MTSQHQDALVEADFCCQVSQDVFKYFIMFVQRVGDTWSNGIVTSVTTTQHVRQGFYHRQCLHWYPSWDLRSVLFLRWWPGPTYHFYGFFFILIQKDVLIVALADVPLEKGSTASPPSFLIYFVFKETSKCTQG